MSDAAGIGSRFRGRLFGPGLASDGVEVPFSASALGLAIDHEPPVDVPSWSGVRWRNGGFNNSQLFLEWPSDAGGYSLTVSDESAKAALLTHLKAGQQHVHTVSRGTRRASIGLLITLVGVPLLLLGLFLSQTDRIVDWAVSRIPVDTEIKLGRQAFAQHKATLSIEDDHPALPMLRELGRKLTQGSPYPYEFYIAKDATVNAFAMPGGFVVFHSGLLAKADSAEEVAGVLAHEIQHVERRHGLRGLVHSAGWQVILSLVLGEAGASMAGTWAANLGALQFSRSQESEADALGATRLMTFQIDPRGMATFFRKLASEGSNVPTLLSSHPASEDRLRAVEAMVPAGTTFPALPYDYARLKGSP